MNEKLACAMNSLRPIFTTDKENEFQKLEIDLFVKHSGPLSAAGFKHRYYLYTTVK